MDDTPKLFFLLLYITIIILFVLTLVFLLIQFKLNNILCKFIKFKQLNRKGLKLLWYYWYFKYTAVIIDVF